MKEKTIEIVHIYEEHSKRILSIAATLYLIVALLSYCLLFKQSQSLINEIAVAGLDVIRKCAFLIFLISIVYNLWKKRLDWRLCAFFFLLSGAVTFFSKDSEPVKMFFLLTAFSILPFDFILKKYYNVQRFILILVITLTAFGGIENILYDKDRMRFGLGFDWTTTAAILLLHILIFYNCVRRYKWKENDVYLYGLLIMIIYLFTDSRFVLIMSIVFLVSAIAQQRFEFFNYSKKWINILLVCLPAGLFIISCLSFLLYDPNNGIWNSVNRLLSDRLALGHDGIIRYGTSLFGQSIQWIGYSFTQMGGKYNYIDNSYVRFFLETGVLETLFYLGITTFGMWGLWKNNQLRKGLSMLFLIILGFIDPFFFNPLFNPFLIYGFKMMNDWVLKRTAQRRLERSL